jgi:NAD(P)-dependent dehydrogenase (short-subunit alcohol dehydrogenase family)
VYALIQAALPGMIERGGGTIITVGSVAAMRPGLIGGAPYGAAKAGVLNLMGHVHTVLRDKGIRATTVMPAEVDTPILDNRPAAARRGGARHHDAAGGRGGGHPDVRDASRAHGGRGDHPEPHAHRDQSRDVEVARNLGAPPGVK